MASLYRKHRPQRFSELVGQDHVTTALRNAVTEDRAGHAYLFSGPRGTGKTTAARLLAKALNCLDLQPDGEPCGKCESCEAIVAGRFPDLYEQDAASKRSVAEMRDLLQSIAIGLSVRAKRKVYVLDEVHMLTADASNTLLKSLEEPPEHVVFVLATTSPDKVLPTIRSRCQHFEFGLLTRDQLAAHLRDVLAREGVDADDEAVGLIAKRAAGSARDALSLLDQALALGGGRLDGDAVSGAMSGTPFEQRMAILDAASADDPAGALAAVDASIRAGNDPRTIADDLLRTLRDAFVLVMAQGRVPYEGPEEDVESLRALAEHFGQAAIVRGIDTLGQAIVDIRGPAAVDPRLVLEVAVVRLARRDSRPPIDALAERVDRLERQQSGDAPRVTPRAPAPVEPTAPERSPRAGGPHVPSRATEERPPDEAPTVPPPTEGEVTAAGGPITLALDDVVEAWAAVLSTLPVPKRASIQEAQPIATEGDTIVFGVSPARLQGTEKRFKDEADTIREAFAARLGGPPRFRLRPHDFDDPRAFAPPVEPPAVSGAAVDVVDVRTPHDDDVVDLDELEPADAGPVVDPQLARLTAQLGAEVVEERPRG
jgi:DNA polymerase-3 subunit gamma/tau